MAYSHAPGLSLELVGAQVLEHNLSLGLQLEQFEREAHEFGRSCVGVRSTNVRQLARVVNQRRGVQRETVFLCEMARVGQPELLQSIKGGTGLSLQYIES